MSSDKPIQRPRWLKALWLGLALLACLRVSWSLSFDNGMHVAFWLPAGVYVAGLLLTDTSDWLALVLAATVVDVGYDLSRGTPFMLSAMLSLANTCEAVVGAYLFRRFFAPSTRLTVIKEFLGLVACAAVIGAAVGASIGAAAFVWTLTSTPPLNYQSIWVSWWISNAMAILIVAPFALIWVSPAVQSQRWWREPRRMIEAAVILCGLGACTWHMLVIGGGIMTPYKTVLLPFFLWAALRFGIRGASAMNLLFALLITFLTSHYLKGLTHEELRSNTYISTMQIFLAVCPLVGLIPAIAIAERDQLVQALGHSEERFRKLTEAANESIVISENGRVLDVNDQALRLFGYERGEITGRAVVELVSPESRTLVSEAIASDREIAYEHRLLRKDGGAFEAEARAKVMQFGERKIRMTAIRDVSERKRAEEALRESEAKFRQIAENIHEVFWIYDVHKPGLVYASPAYEKVWGEVRREPPFRPEALDRGGPPGGPRACLAAQRADGPG